MRELRQPVGQLPAKLMADIPLLCWQPLVRHSLFIPAPQPPPTNDFPPGLTGQSSSVSFLYKALCFPAFNAFHSGTSRPANSRPSHLFLQSKFQSFARDSAPSAPATTLRSPTFHILFCSLFLFFLFPPRISFLHFFIQYTEFLFFPYFFADFYTKKTGRISAAGNRRYFANFFASSFAYSFVMSSSIAISYTPEYQVENLSPVHI